MGAHKRSDGLIPWSAEAFEADRLRKKEWQRQYKAKKKAAATPEELEAERLRKNESARRHQRKKAASKPPKPPKPEPEPKPDPPKKVEPEMVASVAIEFLETLIIPEGKLAGQNMRLATFQKEFIKGTFAPGVMVSCLSIGRGNAKTALAAGLALGHLIGAWDAQPRREIILAARNRDQARIAFGFLTGFIEGMPEELQMQFKIRRGTKLEVEFFGAGGGLARVIAADAKSVLGGSPTFVVMDERAAWESAQGDALENALLSGMGKRDGKALIISTSAPDDANAFSRWVDAPPPGAYVQEHRPEFGLPPDDLDSLKIANPGATEGIGASLEWLVAQAERAIARGGPALASFRNLNRNERTSTEDRSVLVTVDEWLASECDPADLPARSGPCVLGIDLGGSRSMSAAAFYWPETGRLECVGCFPAVPDLAARGAADGVSGRYVDMNARGELQVMGDATVPPGRWLASLADHADGYPIATICGDRYRHAEFMEALQQSGLAKTPYVARGMGWKDGSEDVERFRRSLFDGNIKCLPSLLLRSAFSDAIVLIDPAGNAKLAKARSKGRIDAAAATILAVAEGARMLARPAPQVVRLGFGT